MPRWFHRPTKTQLISVASADLPHTQSEYIEEPDYSAVQGQPVKYWEISGNVITLADQATRDAIDAIEDSTRLDNVADELDRQQTIMRAFAEVVLAEINKHALKINEILDAIDGASNLSQIKAAIDAITDLPPRTLAQLKTAVRKKL